MRKNHLWPIALGFFVLVGLPFFTQTLPGLALTLDRPVTGAHPGPPWFTVSFVSGCLILAGARMWNPPSRAPWYCLAAAHFSFTIATLVNWLQQSTTTPQLADIFYLSVYAYLLASLVLFTWDRRRLRDVRALLDAIILGLGFAAFAIVPALAEHANDHRGHLDLILLSDAYSLAAFVAFIGVIRLVLTAGEWNPLYAVLLASYFLLLLAEFLLSVLGFGELTPWTYDLPEYIFFAAGGVLALHPRMASVATANTPYPIRIPEWRVVLVTVVGVSPFVRLISIGGYRPYLEVACMITYVALGVRYWLGRYMIRRTMEIVSEGRLT